MKTRALRITLGSLACLALLATFSTSGAQVPTSRTLPTLEDGTSIDKIVINGPPTPPPGYDRIAVDLPEANRVEAIIVLSNVPAFDWSYGCSATSGAMIAGYYDRTGYANMYTGPTNGGVMPMDNSSWPDSVDGHGDTRHECPLSATHNGYDGRITRGHVDDYWVAYGDPGPDPFIGNWSEHTYGDCTGDYMKTNQFNFGNSDGSTAFWNYTNGAPYHWYQMEANGDHTDDGGYGLKLFYESRGYTVLDAYNQHRLGYDPPGAPPPTTQGFTYDLYKAEIDAGRPVMVHVEGHTMVGVGYDDTSSDLMYIHDTWDYNTHTMIWGGSYSGMDHMGVTIVQLEVTTPAPTVTSITPSSGVNTGVVHITNLAGSDFQSGATVKLTKSGQSNIDATGVTVVDATRITCDFDLTGAAIGQWNVVVTNPDSQTDQLDNGFTVKAPPPAPDVSIIKRAAGHDFSPGDPITFTLTIANNGNKTAAHVIVTDILSIQQVLDPTIASTLAITRTGGPPPFAWNVEPLGIGASGVITIYGQINPILPSDFAFVNRATIWDLEDNTPDNNTSVVIVGGHRVYLPLVLRN